MEVRRGLSNTVWEKDSLENGVRMPSFTEPSFDPEELRITATSSPPARLRHATEGAGTKVPASRGHVCVRAAFAGV